VQIEEVSNDLPNLSACSYSLLAETHDELMHLASKRFNSSDQIYFP